MGTVLSISSQVAASRVGTSAGGFVLRRLGHEAVVLPTVLLGRHPGWGPPGGGAVEVEHLQSMWAAIRQQDLRFDAVQTGYFATAPQVSLAASIIDAVEPAIVMVDPVIGDHGGLYVPQDVAEAIRDLLLPRATVITPNLWEFGWLGGNPDNPASTLDLAPSALITSWPEGDRIGALHIDADGAHRVSHQRFASVPHGGGDTLAALWLAHALDGMAPEANLCRSVGSVFKLLRGTLADDRSELMLARDQDALLHPEPLEAHRV